MTTYFSYLMMRGYSISEARGAALRILKDMSMTDVMNTEMGKLSGGMVKRVFWPWSWPLKRWR
jgi:ABC-type Mn2+/Zn2+ transport system ATPase subunit